MQSSKKTYVFGLAEVHSFDELLDTHNEKPGQLEVYAFIPYPPGCDGVYADGATPVKDPC
jgi:hypothetical protein